MPYSSPVNPRDHICDIPDLDYSRVNEGFIRCTVCPRFYRLRPIMPKGATWLNSCPNPMPREHIDWLAGHTPYPPPTEEEILRNRQLRLEKLDQIQRDKNLAWNESKAALQELQKERGFAKADSTWYHKMREKRQKDEPEKITVRVRLKVSLHTMSPVEKR